MPSASTAAIPLVALRPTLAGGWPSEARRVRPEAASDARLGAFQQPVGSSVAFRMRVPAGAYLRAVVALAPSERATVGGSVRARVLIRDGERVTEVWSGIMANFLGMPGRQRLRVDARLEPTDSPEVDLILRAEPLRVIGAGVEHIRWEAPVIEFPSSDAEARRNRSLTGSPAKSARGAVTVDRLEHGSPLFSILTPVHDPEPGILRETLASVRRQAFGDWELCLVDDGSKDPRVLEILQRVVSEDPRIRLSRHEQAGGISNATNTALGTARGEYVALLDHDDILVDEALELVASAIAENPDADMLYSDEAVVDDVGRVGVFLKPSWSPDLLRSQMYTCHLSVYRCSLAVELEGFRPAFDGSQDYDFALRFSERASRIVHVPHLLYHWRSHEKSTATNAGAKPHTSPAGQRAIAEHLERTGVDAAVHFGPTRSLYRVVHSPDSDATVTMVLPVPESRGSFLQSLGSASRSWLAEERVSWNLVLVGSACALAESAEMLPDAVRDGRLQTVEAGSELGRAARLNRAIEASSGRYLALLEGPWEALTREWLSCLVGFASQPGVGAVGAKAVAPDGRVEHAGVVLHEGLPVTVRHGADRADPGPLGILQVAGNLSAVSGTIVTRREIFEGLGGIDGRFNELAEVDFCLRALERGMRIVSAPDAMLLRLGDAPIVNDLDELDAFQARWGSRIGDDFYFGPEARAGLIGLS